MLEPTGVLLWIQPLLLVAVVAATARSGLEVVRGIRWHPAAIVLAVAAPLVLVGLLPPGEYHFSGHEGAYGELLDGGMPLEDLGSFRIMPLPSGIAWTLGQLVPGDQARVLWILLNRVSLLLVLLAAAAAAGGMAKALGSDSRLATLVAVLTLLASAPLAGWSITAWAVVPAVAFSAAGLAFAMAGRAPEAALWATLGLSTRADAVGLLVGSTLLALALRPVRQQRLTAAIPAAVLVCAIEVLALVSKAETVPVEAGDGLLSIALQNTGSLALGGPWLQPATLCLLVAVAIVALARGKLLWGVLGVLLCTLVPLLPLPDLGARHFLGASVVGCCLLATVFASSRWYLGLVVVLAASQPAIVGWAGLHHRYAAGVDAFLPAWQEAADGGGARTLSGWLDPDCYLVLPGGEEAYKGASHSGDVREVQNAALERSAGACVQWAAYTDAEFLGDCTAERLDRAILVLDLQPVGWIERPGGARWMLWEAR